MESKILELQQKLDKLIEEDASTFKILELSVELDDYIYHFMSEERKN